MDVIGQFIETRLDKMGPETPAFFPIDGELVLGFFEPAPKDSSDRGCIRFPIAADGRKPQYLSYCKVPPEEKVWPLRDAFISLDQTSFILDNKRFAPIGSIAAFGSDLYLCAGGMNQHSEVPMSYDLKTGVIRTGSYSKPFYSRWSLIDRYTHAVFCTMDALPDEE